MLAGVALMCGFAVAAGAQDSGQGSSLGDLGRKTRQEHTSKDHVTAKQVLTEDSQAARGATWVVHACRHVPCYSLVIALPKNAQWSKPASGQTYATIPLHGHESDPNHIIRVYAADLLNTYTLDQGKRLFLQEWFSRPYFFGQSAKFEFDDQTTIDGNSAVITHFTLPNKVGLYRGLGLIAWVPAGTFGFACVFRDDDSGDATSVCEGVLNSGRISMMEETKPKGQAAVDDDEDCGCSDDDSQK
ncbi:MAG TPA: hypothetical protein VKR60_12030 [Candidatus Sulfotelmatobacter sp.]|nr:hypothetical protein [Candidatus Sulfotelmatobacter sp.]